MEKPQPGNALRRAKVKVGKDGRFVIPLAFRAGLGLKCGDELVMSWKDGELCLTKAARKRKQQRRTG